MNGTMVLTIIIAVITFLVFLAFLLDRRSKKKGNMLFGGNEELVPAQGKYTYIFLALLILGTFLLIWGFYIHSGFLQILGGIIFIVSLILRWYWTLKTLIKASKK